MKAKTIVISEYLNKGLKSYTVDNLITSTSSRAAEETAILTNFNSVNPLNK